jgi:hypothetical protein
VSQFRIHILVASMIGYAFALVCAADTDLSTRLESSPKAPRIVFDNTEYDLGIVSNVDFVSGTITFQNAGDADLHVKVHWGAFSGTIPTFEPVPPGKKGSIPFRPSVRGVRGKVTKTIKIETDDPINPVIPVTITVNNSSINKK